MTGVIRSSFRPLFLLSARRHRYSLAALVPARGANFLALSSLASERATTCAHPSCLRLMPQQLRHGRLPSATRLAEWIEIIDEVTRDELLSAGAAEGGPDRAKALVQSFEA